MHTCPDCGQACYCGGDIDDHETGEDDNCQHWMECEDEADDDDLFNRDGPNPMACCFKCGHAVHSGECVNVAPNANVCGLPHGKEDK